MPRSQRPDNNNLQDNHRQRKTVESEVRCVNPRTLPKSIQPARESTLRPFRLGQRLRLKAVGATTRPISSPAQKNEGIIVPNSLADAPSRCAKEAIHPAAADSIRSAEAISPSRRHPEMPDKSFPGPRAGLGGGGWYWLMRVRSSSFSILIVLHEAAGFGFVGN
jgi:hypothetical protein